MAKNLALFVSLFGGAVAGWLMLTLYALPKPYPLGAVQSYVKKDFNRL
jgi:hypothetical protein